MIISGIYIWFCSISNKSYVGQSVDLGSRWKEHVKLANKGFQNDHLQAAWNLYGASFFHFHILEVLHPCKELLDSREQFWLDHFQSYDSSKGYNICKVASSVLGYKHTDNWKIGHRERLKRMRDSVSRKATIAMSLPGDREAVSKSSLEAFQNPEIQSRHSESQRARWTPENRKLASLRSVAPEIVEKRRVGLVEAYKDPNLRQKASELAKKRGMNPSIYEGQRRYWEAKRANRI